MSKIKKYDGYRIFLIKLNNIKKIFDFLFDIDIIIKVVRRL